MKKAVTPNVWIVNHQFQDVSHAATFGTIKYVTEGQVNTFNVDSLIGIVSKAFQDSQAEDWLVPTGSMLLGILAAVEMVRRHGRLNILLWHAKSHVYVPRIIKATLGVDINEPFLHDVIQGDGNAD